MSRVALWFFAVAPIYVLVGMGFGNLSWVRRRISHSHPRMRISI